MTALTQQQQTSLNDQLDKARAFVKLYPKDELVGDTSIEAWRQWFELYTGTKVHVEITTDTDKVGLNHDGTWTLGLKLDDHVSAGYHEKCHVIFSPFDEIRKAGDITANKMNDRRIRHIVNVLEDAGIERLGDRLLWPTLAIRDNHRADLMRQTLDEPTLAVIGGDTNPFGNAANISSGILKAVYDLPMINLDPIVKDVLAVFRDDIEAAVKDLRGWQGFGDKMVSVRLAIRIAAYLKWKEQTQPPEPPTDDPGEPCDDGEGQPADPHDDDDSGDSGDSGDSDGGDSPDDSESDDTTQDGSGCDISDSDLDELIEDIEKQTKREVNKVQRRKGKLAPPVSTNGNYDQHHPYNQFDVPGDEPPLHKKLRSMLDSISEPLSLPRSSTRGRINPRRLHALQNGDMKVFTARPKTRGPVLIMVDCSGSMSCRCASCTESYIEYMDKQQPPVGDYIPCGDASWQIARSIARSVGYDAEVYGFDGNGGYAPTSIGRVMPRQQPKHGWFGGGTPICTALSFIEHRLGGNTNQATIVFITDGMPNQCPAPTGNGVTHSMEIANRLNAGGADFVAIQLGSFRDIFPSSLCLKIPSDYSGVLTDDLASIGDAIKHIRGR
jgi:hypothetical protein